MTQDGDEIGALRPNTFFCIDGHTCGNPVRLVAGGGPSLQGATMSERRQDFLARYDWVRTGLMFEPRVLGQMKHSWMANRGSDQCQPQLTLKPTKIMRLVLYSPMTVPPPFAFSIRASPKSA